MTHWHDTNTGTVVRLKWRTALVSTHAYFGDEIRSFRPLRLGRIDNCPERKKQVIRFLSSFEEGKKESRGCETCRPEQYSSS